MVEELLTVCVPMPSQKKTKKKHWIRRLRTIKDLMIHWRCYSAWCRFSFFNFMPFVTFLLLCNLHQWVSQGIKMRHNNSKHRSNISVHFLLVNPAFPSWLIPILWKTSRFKLEALKSFSFGHTVISLLQTRINDPHKSTEIPQVLFFVPFSKLYLCKALVLRQAHK